MSFFKDRFREPSSHVGIATAANGVFGALTGSMDWRMALANVLFGALGFFVPEAARVMTGGQGGGFPRPGQ